MTIEQQLQKMGWELEVLGVQRPGAQRTMLYRARCGGFTSGPHRAFIEAVLSDVLAIKSKENAEVKQPFPNGRYAGKSEGGV